MASRTKQPEPTPSNINPRPSDVPPPPLSSSVGAFSTSFTRGRSKSIDDVAQEARGYMDEIRAIAVKNGWDKAALRDNGVAVTMEPPTKQTWGQRKEVRMETGIPSPVKSGFNTSSPRKAMQSTNTNRSASQLSSAPNFSPGISRSLRMERRSVRPMPGPMRDTLGVQETPTITVTMPTPKVSPAHIHVNALNSSSNSRTSPVHLLSSSDTRAISTPKSPVRVNVMEDGSRSPLNPTELPTSNEVLRRKVILGRRIFELETMKLGMHDQSKVTALVGRADRHYFAPTSPNGENKGLDDGILRNRERDDIYLEEFNVSRSVQPKSTPDLRTAAHDAEENGYEKENGNHVGILDNRKSRTSGFRKAVNDLTRKSVGTPPATRRAIEEDMRKVRNSFGKTIGLSYIQRPEPECVKTSSTATTGRKEVAQSVPPVKMNNAFRQRMIAIKKSCEDLTTFSPQRSLLYSTLRPKRAKFAQSTPANPNSTPVALARAPRASVFDTPTRPAMVGSTIGTKLKVASAHRVSRLDVDTPKDTTNIPTEKPWTTTSGAQEISQLIKDFHAQSTTPASVAVRPFAATNKSATPPNSPRRVATNNSRSSMTHVKIAAPSTPLPSARKRHRTAGQTHIAVRTPSRQVQSSLDRAIDARIAEEAGRGGMFSTAMRQSRT